MAVLSRLKGLYRALTPSRTSLAILGSYPPPFGGVANHVRRLSAVLSERGISYTVFNAVSATHDGDRVITVRDYRVPWLIAYAATGDFETVYILSDRLTAWLVVIPAGRARGKRVVLRLRNTKLLDSFKQSTLTRSLAAWSLRNASGVVAVSESLAEAARAAGVPGARVHTSPGYLPPREFDLDQSLVSPALVAFCKKHRPLLLASGAVYFYFGEDMYGLDLMVLLAAKLKPEFPGLGIAISFIDNFPGDAKYLAKLWSKARDLGVEDTLFVNTDPGPLVPVMALADVFLRPTNTDGDANSVREALAFGVPVVASDAVARPPGTVLFRNRDVSDFAAAVRRALAAPRPPNAEIRRSPSEERRIDEYIEFLTGRSLP